MTPVPVPNPAMRGQLIMQRLMGLAEAERDGRDEKAIIKIGPFSAYTVIAVLQLAWRHPSLSPHQKIIIRNIADQLEPLFDGLLAEMIEAGWDTEQDQ